MADARHGSLQRNSICFSVRVLYLSFMPQAPQLYSSSPIRTATESHLWLALPHRILKVNICSGIRLPES